MVALDEGSAFSPHIVVAPDKFKGSLNAAEVANAVASGILEIIPDARISAVPIADGGDGTVAAARAAGFDSRSRSVTGPLGGSVKAEYALKGSTAVIEMATASGLALLDPADLDALASTSRGTGELISAALDDGATTIILGVGGSASTDAGADMLEALGVRILDAAGAPVPPGGGGLARAASVDISQLDDRVAAANVILATDVDNPLTGEHGAAAVYGAQKGAGTKDIARLDNALSAFAAKVNPGTAAEPGAGAAGGVGFAALAVLGATVRPGVDVVLEFVGFEKAFVGADLLVTGEGKLDHQTLRGKGPAGVADYARKRDVPVVAVCGSNELDSPLLKASGIQAVYALNDVEPNLEICLAEPGRLLAECGRSLAEDNFRHGAASFAPATV